ncbi:Histone deacetylase HOS3 [Escovopsis weberi]|uniref:Histone deacetylase HOS3 n=1 Tax=Escovopsis weberi TaxID=150374 RepID=A0A0M8N6T1_ESCWE|nr:Histone deacetylase HOS3 [Escovopsis weberi]
MAVSPNTPSRGLESRAGTPPLIRKASMNSLHSAANGAAAAQARSVSRRSSSGQILSPSAAANATANSTSPARNPAAIQYHVFERGPITGPAIAKSYFQAELEAHHGPVSALKTETVVIVDDAVYGHRFSRPRTSKNALASIVERPERIKAGLLGVSLAYVRLGERHSDGAFPIHPKRNMETLPSIPFRIHKSSRRLSLSSPAVTNVHGTKWMEDLKRMCENAESILAMGGKELQRPTSSNGPAQPPQEDLHEGDLYLCSESLSAMEGALGAVCEAVDTVFSLGPRRAFVAIRPPGHHCSASQPSGFCWVNNVHVGIMHAVLNHDLTHAVIIDFDLHHGDGSQSIAWAHNARAAAAHKNHAAWKRTSIGYFSLHDINSYPCETGDGDKVRNASVCIDNAHGQSVWNVHLETWETEQEFWELYQSKYMVLLRKARKYLKVQAARLKAAKQEPRAAIFLSAGFDASEWESPGMQRHKANVPTEFYARLTQDVIQLAAEEGLFVEGRIVSVLEGGYSDRALYSGILSHLSGLVGNHTCENPLDDLCDPAGDPSAKLTPGSTDDVLSTTNTLASIYPYDSSWWAAPELDKLDELMAQPPEPPPKVLRISSSPAPAYSSPTQSSQAKMVDPLKARRSFSGLPNVSSRPSPRSPSPSLPDINWMVAARELSRLLIPSDRQTDSCTAEDLNAEATRARRASIIEGMESMSVSERDRPNSRMLLRDRKSRSSIDPIREEGSVVVAKNRRKPPTAAEPEQMTSDLPLRRTSRRLSVASHKAASDSVSSIDSASHRPPTSTGSRSGSRPPSSIGSRPPSISIGLANARKPRGSISSRRDISPRTPCITSTSPPDAEVGPGSARSEQGRDDLSNITNGMRRIKINLITQSQKEARERARAEEDNESLGLEPESSPVQDVPPMSFGHSPSPRTVPALTTTSESGLSTPVLEHYPSGGVFPEMRQASTSENSPNVTVRPNDEASDPFVPYQPDGPAPVAISQQEPLKWLPPSVSNPAAKPSTQSASKLPSPIKDKGRARTATSIPTATQPAGRQPTFRRVSPKQT